MLIRLGYEIAIECQQPTPIISLLEIHEDRQPDIKRQTRVITSPSVPSSTYRDRYGNNCRRFHAPTGSFRILYDAVVEDSGKLDEVNPQAREVPVQELPDEVLGYLLGSRYCETDHLSNLAWSLFGNVSPGWSRVQAVTDYVHNRLSFGYGYARSTRTAAQAHDEQVGVCRDFAHLAIALCRCLNIPARYVKRLSRRHRRAGRPGADGFFAPGSRPFSTASGTHSMHATMSRAWVGWSWHAAATPPTCRCCTVSGRTASACSRSGPTNRKATRPSRPITGWIGRSAPTCSPSLLPSLAKCA